MRQAAEGVGRALGHITPRGTDAAFFGGEWEQMQEAARDAAEATVASQAGKLTEQQRQASRKRLSRLSHASRSGAANTGAGSTTGSRVGTGSRIGTAIDIHEEGSRPGASGGIGERGVTAAGISMRSRPRTADTHLTYRTGTGSEHSTIAGRGGRRPSRRSRRASIEEANRIVFAREGEIVVDGSTVGGGGPNSVGSYSGRRAGLPPLQVSGSPHARAPNTTDPTSFGVGAAGRAGSGEYPKQRSPAAREKRLSAGAALDQSDRQGLRQGRSRASPGGGMHSPYQGADGTPLTPTKHASSDLAGRQGHLGKNRFTYGVGHQAQLGPEGETVGAASGPLASVGRDPTTEMPVA